MDFWGDFQVRLSITTWVVISCSLPPRRRFNLQATRCARMRLVLDVRLPGGSALDPRDQTAGEFANPIILITGWCRSDDLVSDQIVSRSGATGWDSPSNSARLCEWKTAARDPEKGTRHELLTWASSKCWRLS